MRKPLLALILFLLLAGCDHTGNSLQNLEPADFVFPQDAFTPACSLRPTEFDNGLVGNPILSSEPEHAQIIAANWFDNTIAGSAEDILISIYHGKNQPDEIGLLVVEFKSNTAAKSLEEYLKDEHPGEAGNKIYREGEIVIWLWHAAPEPDACFDKLKELVEKEIGKSRLEIEKRF